jgi:hypothetical protein
MKLKLLSLTVALAITASSAFASDTFERTINVSAQPDLYVSTGSGNIHINPGTDNQIHIVGHVHAGWSAFGDVRDRIQHIIETPPITQNGNSIHVGNAGSNSLFNSISIDYEITAPADVALNLHSGSGDIQVNNLGRFLTVTDGSGDVRAHGIHGPASLESGSGDLELEQTGPGDVKAKTGSGSVRIHGLDGAFYARTGSGDIEADGRLTGTSDLATGSGDIRLHLNQDAHFNVEAATGSGDIRINFPGAPKQTDNTRHHMNASINGGGPVLEIRTGSGDVEIDGGGH